ncbi:MAG: 50S ribosomal protein L31e [Candidatus Nanoarchaeia archaeon]
MADEERTYIIPLRREWLKVARYRRSKKAVSAVRSFIQKHMKVENVRIGRHLNMRLWSRGMKNPPHKVAVKAVKVVEKEGTYIKVELVGAPEEKPVEKKKKGLAAKLKEKVAGKEEKPKVEKEVKKDKKKPEKKEELPKEEPQKEKTKEEK